jgi:7,8-dihydro-6-hydroxymethylpterin-pyrophosphokinase
MWERAFVLRPLSDLLPDLVSPEGLPVKELLQKKEIASQGLWPDNDSEASKNERA